MKNFLFLILISIANLVFGKTFNIRSAAELNALRLLPGDRVILNGGDWKDQHLVFKANGTEVAPILLTVDYPGVSRLTGNSNLIIDGSWLVVDGVYFTDGFSLKGDVIVFSAESENCRLTNSGMYNYNHPDKKVDYKWVSVYGHRNRVDHCWLEGKTHQGTTLVIWMDERPDFDRIDHNYFGHRPDLGVNGGETIRVGNSTWSQHDSYATIEKNIFEHCDGEIEIISNKSCKNILRDNLFFECKGTLTLRHGKDAQVYGNYFIGNGLEETGGIRIIDANHKVHNNYFEGITGKGLKAAISIMDGLPNPELTSHWQVKNADVENNLIIDCKQSLNLGSGKNADRYLKAENTLIANNVIVTKNNAVDWSDDSVVVDFRNNIVWDPADRRNLPPGFVVRDPGLLRDRYGIYELPGKKNDPPFWTQEESGPFWKRPRIKIRPDL